jgi:hypothetical protein
MVFSLAAYRPTPQLQIKKLVASMKHLANGTLSDKMEYEIYVSVYHEWLKLMTHLGKCVSLGFNDLIHKAKCMENNRVLLCSQFKYTDTQGSKYLMDFI